MDGQALKDFMKKHPEHVEKNGGDTLLSIQSVKEELGNNSVNEAISDPKKKELLEDFQKIGVPLD